MREETINIPGRDQEETVNIISRFIRNKAEESRTSGVVIGLSGGLDSSITAYLCAKSLENDQILGIIMPTITTPLEDVEDAISVAEALGN